MSKIKIIHDRQECIGCGTCVALCPDFWEMGKDGKSELKGSKKVGKKQELVLTDIKCNKEAAESCPVNCIHIEENGKKII